MNHLQLSRARALRLGQRFGQRLGQRLGQHFGQRLGQHFGQRLGQRLWHQISARFPTLAELLRGPTSASVPAPPAGALQQRDDLATLIATLRDPSAEIAAIAAIKLGTRREPEVTYALSEALDNADGYFSPLTRVAALQAFTQRLPAAPSTGDVATLTSLVRDVDAEVSMAAIDAVAQRAPASVAIDSLLPVVLDDTGFFLPIVRAAATRALERAGLMTTASA